MHYCAPELGQVSVAWLSMRCFGNSVDRPVGVLLGGLFAFAGLFLAFFYPVPDVARKTRED